MIDELFADIAANDIKAQNENIQKLQDLQNRSPFDFVANCCIFLNADSSDKRRMEKLITYIAATFKRNDFHTIWIAQDQNKKIAIKRTLINLINDQSQIIYENAAISIFIVGSIEYQCNQWTTFFSDIFGLITGQSETFENNIAAALLVIQNSVETELINPSLPDFDRIISLICEIFLKFVSNSSNFTSSIKPNYLNTIRKKCFDLIQSSIPLLSKFIVSPGNCDNIIQLILKTEDQYRPDVYRLLSSIYKYYYNSATNSMLDIFTFSMMDINGVYVDREIDAIRFWSKIAKIEYSIEGKIKYKNFAQKQKPVIKSNHFILGVYKYILPKLFEVFESINLQSEYSEETDELEDVALECLSGFAKIEPRAIIPEIADFFRLHIKKKSDSSRYSALKVLSSVYKMCPFDMFSNFLIRILECVESPVEKLACSALSLAADLISAFPLQITMSDASDIIASVQGKLDLPESFEVLARLVATRRFDNEFEKLREMIFVDEKDIGVAFPAIVAFIQNTRDDTTQTLPIFELLSVKFHEIDDELDERGSKICRALREAVIKLNLSGADLSAYIKPLADSIINKFYGDYDDDLIDLVCSFHKYLFENAPDFLEQVIRIALSKMAEGNTQIIISSSELISDLFLSNAEAMKPHLETVSEAFLRILKDDSTLRDVHSPVLSAVADIINSLGYQSALTCQMFSPILSEYVKVPLSQGKKNDREYAECLFEALLRDYTAITNFADTENTDFLMRILKPIFILFKRIHQTQIINPLILNFVVCIVNSLYCILKNKVTFMTHHKAVRELLKDSLDLRLSDELTQRAQNLYTVLYTNQ